MVEVPVNRDGVDEDNDDDDDDKSRLCNHWNA